MKPGSQTLIFILALLALVSNVIGHAELYSPRPRRGGQVCCGNRGDGVGKPQNNVPGTNCGLCGEDVVSSRPRNREFGGLYGSDGPQTVFTEGQWIDVKVGVPNPHGFFMEFRLSPNAYWESTRNQNAFSYLLTASYPISPSDTPNIGQDSRFPTRLNVNIGSGNGIYFNAKVKLPTGLTCDNCVIQYNYRGRATESFRSCSDIRIISANAPFDLLQEKESGKCLSVSDDEKSFNLVTCNANDLSQNVIRYRQWNDYLTINNKIGLKSTNLCLQISNAKTANNASVIPSACKAGATDANLHQRWSFRNTENGYSLVNSASSGRVLSVIKSTGKIVIYDDLTQSASQHQVYSQLWKVIRANTETNVVPLNIMSKPVINGVMYCPGRESGTLDGCWDIPLSQVAPTPKFTRLMNVETGKCLSQCVNNSLILAPCDSTDPFQSITLFQSWDQYEGWNHAIGLSSITSCIDFKQEWYESGIGNAVLIRDCVLSMNNYRENQFWGTKTTNYGASFQIFSQSTGFCLTAARHSGKGSLQTCYANSDVTNDYQYWKVVNDQVVPFKSPPVLPQQIPKYNNLKNDETGNCLTAVPNKPLSLVKCNDTDPNQSVTLFQSWKSYEEWNQAIIIGHDVACLTIDNTNKEAKINVPLQECKLSLRNYRDYQFWGTRKAEDGTYQIFLQNTNLWLSASKSTTNVFLYSRFDNRTDAKYNQYWTYIEN